MRWPKAKTMATTALVAIAASVAVARLDALAPVPARADESAIVQSPVVGGVPASHMVTPIENSGNYGLGLGPIGSRYAIVGGYLVRIDMQSGKILSVLRPLPDLPR